MMVAVIRRPGCLELETRAIPAPTEGQVLVRVAVCGVCASDVAVMSGHLSKPFPYSPGHEFCGRVEQRGAKVTHLQPGQLVVINPNLGCGECRYCRDRKPNLCDFLKSRSIKSNGGFAEYVALDSRMVYAVPAGMSEVLATFVEQFSCALHVAKFAEDVQPERVAVFGAGMLGILTALVLKDTKRKVVLIEPNDTRREQARALLGVATLTPDQLTSSEWYGSFDATIDCSGRIEAVAQAIGASKKAGRIVLAGVVGNHKDAPLPLAEITVKELELKGAWLNPHTFEDAIQLALKHRETLAALETEIYPLDQIAAAFARAASPEAKKVLVKP